MIDDYGINYIRNRAGSYVCEFLKPYILKYSLKVDINRSTDKDIHLLGEDGGYAGKITSENGTSKFTVYLNEEGTIILSGEATGRHISGVVEQTDEIDRGNLESFTTLSVDFYGARTESSKSYYKENVSNVARTFTPIPLNWTWSEINALFITRGKELIPTHTKRYDDITPTEFMDETMKEYNVANYTGQKTA